MALTYSRQLLSGSTNGRPIGISSTSSPGTTLHTVQATATAAREEVFLYAAHNATATSTTRLLTLELGGTATTDNVVINVGGGEGIWAVLPGVSFTATSSIIRAFATGAGEFNIMGWVNRAT